ncbi:MAG TPA: hypothetical protein VM056_03970 [Terriglobales bacterium]|nr:hypothetical protein [Terriglobales bacterium]
MAEKVTQLKLDRDYRKFLYFIDGVGNVCRKAKAGDSESEILHKEAVSREDGYLYFVDKDGDVARSPRVARGPNKKPRKAA